MTEDAVRRRLRETGEMIERLSDGDVADVVAQVGRALVAAYGSGKKLVLFGNGGSAAEAQHVAAEFVGRYLKDRPPLPAIALSENSASVTAIGNDYGYEAVFARQLAAFGEAGDVALAMSTGGSSETVVQGLRAARERGMVTVALTGADGGPCGAAADFCIRIPSAETPRIQEGHTVVCHVLCELVERELFE